MNLRARIVAVHSVLRERLQVQGAAADRLLRELVDGLTEALEDDDDPIPMRLVCESCSELHIDAPPWDGKRHHTHACQHCGHVWRPAVVCTTGVRFLPGFGPRVAPPEDDTLPPRPGCKHCRLIGERCGYCRGLVTETPPLGKEILP